MTQMIPEAARKPADHKPTTARRKAPVKTAPPAKTAATLLAPDPRFEVIDDGDNLLYRSKRSGDLTFPLDIPLGSLSDVLDLDGNVEDPRQVVELLKALAGDDVLKIGTRELMPVFERWTAELGAAMGGTLGESDSSPA